jgi:FkbM family methyltransferase
MKTRHKIALARLASTTLRGLRGLIGYSPHTAVTRRGIRWELDLREGIDLSIYLLGSFEPRTVAVYRRLLPRGGIALDIGANIGAHTLRMAQCVGPQGRVIAFEPTAYAIGKLRRNAALNPDLASRIEPEQILLSREDGVQPPPSLYSSWPLTGTDIERHADHGGAFRETQGARAARLDTYLTARAIERVNLIKLDVDGYEVDVLAGAEQTLRRLRPSLILEIAPYVLAERGTTTAQVLEHLSTAHYRLYTENDRPLPMDASAFERTIPAGASMNVIARPV